MATIKELVDRRDALVEDLRTVREELAARAGEVDEEPARKPASRKTENVKPASRKTENAV